MENFSASGGSASWKVSCQEIALNFACEWADDKKVKFKLENK